MSPWFLAAQAAMVLRGRWSTLDPRDRAELTRIMRTFRGRPGNLTAHDKQELRRLVKLLDLPGAGKELLPLMGGRRGGGRGRFF
jgi:hypothetical protein